METIQMDEKGWEGRIIKGQGSSGYAHSDGFMGIYMSKFIKLYILNMGSLLYANYTVIKL